MSSSNRSGLLGVPSASLRARVEQDPWALSLAERRDLARGFATAQTHWLPRLQTLVEPPLPRADFPAYLLALDAFARLRDAIGDARTRGDLDTGTADELQRFVDHYHHYAS